MAIRTSFRLVPVAALALITAPLASGCELFVHFDRTRIGADTATIDGATVDGGGDAGRDGGMDGGQVVADGGLDAAPTDDVGNDAFHDDTGGPDTGCQGISDCPATGNECVVATCTTGLCGTMNLDNTHASATQTANDCQSVVCNGAGGTTPVPDATDHPASTECDTISCSGTTVMHAPLDTTHACTTGGVVCDGAGACVACNVAADCGTAPSVCVARTCSTHTCGTMNLGSTVAPPGLQSPGDCQKIVCNGAGGTTPVDDATDLPTAASVCETNPSCVGPSPLTPSFTPATTGTACSDGGGHVCGDTTMSTIAGTCVGCNTTADCGAQTCNTTTHICS